LALATYLSSVGEQVPDECKGETICFYHR
jgi:hypothetical protein